MKKIKIFLILLTVVLLSGCSVEYNLTINEDSSVNEKVVAKEITNRMKINTGLDKKESVYYLYDMFNREDLDTNLTYKTEKNYTIATVTGFHDSVEAYAQNFKSDVIKEINYTEKNNIVTLQFNQDEILSSTASRAPIYDEITINIEVPFKVVDSNAYESNRDVYTWKIKKDQKVQKMYISYDKTNLKKSRILSIGNNQYNIKYAYVAIVIILLILTIIVAIVYVNNRKNNKI